MPPPLRTRLTAHLALLATAVAWGASFVVVQDALATLSPHTLLVLRFGLAAAALAAAGAAAGRLRAGSATWWAGAGVGVWLYAGFALQTLGLGFTTPARSGFLTGVYVLLVPLTQRGLGVRVPPRVAVAAGLGFTGLALLTRPQAWSDVNPGDVLTLLCAVGFAGHVVVLGRAATRHPPLPLAVAQLAAVGALSVPGAVAETLSGIELAPAAAEAAPGAAAVAGGLLFLGLVCSGGAYLAQSFAQRVVAPTPTALWLSLEAVFAALVSVALGRERLLPVEWLGGGLMVAAVVLAQLPARPSREKPS
ncbi:MAG: DMT family transporter [Myxococcota bacterium]|nr:DMT family transporter [Myxococcota bacterium]